MEKANPAYAEKYDTCHRDRMRAYAPDHPLRLIQPYLITLRAPMPDLSIYDTFDLADIEINPRHSFSD